MAPGNERHRGLTAEIGDLEALIRPPVEPINPRLLELSGVARSRHAAPAQILRA